MKRWSHVTAVRVPLNEACWNAGPYANPASAGTSYGHAVKACVSLLNADGLAVILDLHLDPGRPGQCPNVLITGYAGDPAPFGAADKAIRQALP